jgi:xanthine dehydrogenase accessory factor
VDLNALEARIATLRATHTAFALATVVRTVNATSAKPGAKAIILADGTIEGWLGGGCIRAAISKAAQTALSDGETQFVSLRPEEILAQEGVSAGEHRDGIRFARNGCPSKGSMDIFVEPVLPQADLIILGASPVALALAALAGRYDFTVTLCAPDLPVEQARFTDHFLTDFDALEDRGAAYIVIATQGKGDEAAMRAALAHPRRYCSFVGSHRKFSTLAARLITKGETASHVQQIKAPAGLDIGAITPDEIALSILSEVIHARRARQRQTEVPNVEIA